MMTSTFLRIPHTADQAWDSQKVRGHAKSTGRTGLIVSVKRKKPWVKKGYPGKTTNNARHPSVRSNSRIEEETRLVIDYGLKQA